VATASTTGARTATVTGLTNGQPYTFDVTATNANGTSPASDRTAAVTPRPPANELGAPTIGTATAGIRSASVTWTAPASDGGSAITGYRVQAVNGAGTVVGTADTAAGERTATVTGLRNGTTYRLRVAAVTAAGTSANSANSNSVRTFSTPSVPGILAPTSGTTGAPITATARWNASTGTGGSPITGYRVQAFRGTGTTAVATLTVTADKRSAQFAGLVRGASYTFRVAAINAVGTSANSARSTAATAR
jgi:hypothetical protein